MAAILEAGPKNKKMEEWLQKSPQEQEKIAEENGWRWFFEFFEAGDIIRSHYEKADKSDRVKDKYHGCYDGYYKEHQKGESYVHLGLDGCFHRTEKPTSTWTEYHPCSNKKCPYYDPKGYEDRGGNCGYFGDNIVIGYDCFNGLFATIQQWIDVCGIEELDQLQKHYNIHEDIIGWFKEGDDYFKNKESDKIYLNKEAVNEIWNLTKQVQDVVNLVSKMGIYYHSDPWTAVHPVNHDYEDILRWKREDFEHIDVDNVDSFAVGGSMSHSEYEYKGEWESDPRELAEAKANTIKYYLDDIVKNFQTKYFKIEVYAERPYRDAGWECPIGIEATLIKPKCLKQTQLNAIIKEINEDIDIAYEYNEKECNAETGIKPEGEFAYMLEHMSDLVDPDDEEYKGSFTNHLNGKYIKDAMALINKVEQQAKELQIKYKKYGVVVTIGDFNVGCEYGMCIYFWIPYQTQHDY